MQRPNFGVRRRRKGHRSLRRSNTVSVSLFSREPLLGRIPVCTLAVVTRLSIAPTTCVLPITHAATANTWLPAPPLRAPHLNIARLSLGGAWLALQGSNRSSDIIRWPALQRKRRVEHQRVQPPGAPCDCRLFRQACHPRYARVKTTQEACDEHSHELDD